MTTRAYLALGSNLGERAGQIRQAIGLLQAHGSIRLRQISRFYETEPVNINEDRDPQWFINAVIGIDTEFTPQQLLDVCLNIERKLGRKREADHDAQTGYQSRTIDIDILFYGDEIIQEPDLQIPHPRLHERAFALVPLLDISPELRHPTLNQTVQELHRSLSEKESEQISPMGKKLAVTHS